MRSQNTTTIESPIRCLPYVNEKLEKLLKKLGIETIRDLLFYAPSRYLDFSKISKIENLMPGEIQTVEGQIALINNKKTWKRKMTITEAIIKDDTGQTRAVWFNQPFLTRNLHAGNFVNISGKFIAGKNGAHFQNPMYEKIGIKKYGDKKESPIHTTGIVAVYPETSGITSRWIRFLMKHALNYVLKIPEILPVEIRQKENFLPIAKAIKNLHFPASLEIAKKAEKQLAFQELFIIQLIVLNLKKQIKLQKAPLIKIDLNLIKDFISRLPFELTDSQKKSLWQILKDTEKPVPMNRLLNGDVGSGKTIVAAIAALNAAKQNWQVAYLAPTEILARQHFQTFCKFLQPFGLTITLATGKENRIFESELGQDYEVKKNELLSKINGDKINIAIGTHALIQDKVKFANLGLVIIDEQHRFGINQRAALLKNSNKFPTSNFQLPHLLSMTATPIPRTLTLTIYGDLDISILNEMPKNRQKIITQIILPREKNKFYDFIRNEIKNGGQAFVVCPRIEQGYETQNMKHETQDQNFKNATFSQLEVKTVKEEYKKLSEEIFPDLKVAMIHGKIKPKEKEKIMADFKDNKTDILISTSIIEVGIDIPNASIIIIENADRFGLAQLHQFRGRVGRGQRQSYCFLMADSENKIENERLSALVKSENGFQLAQRDLEIRGPGEFLGTRQSGLPDTIFVSFADIFLLEKVRNYAINLLKNDPLLQKYPAIKEKLKQIQQNTHFE